MRFNLKYKQHFDAWMIGRMERATRSTVKKNIKEICQIYNVQPKRLLDNNAIRRESNTRVSLTVRNKSRAGGGTDNPSNYFITLFHAGGDKKPSNYTVNRELSKKANIYSAEGKKIGSSTYYYNKMVALKRSSIIDANKYNKRHRKVATSYAPMSTSTAREKYRGKSKYTKSMKSYGTYRVWQNKKGKVSFRHVEGYYIPNISVMYGRGKTWDISEEDLKGGSLMYFEINQHKGLFIKYRQQGKKAKYRELYAMSVAQLEMNMNRRNQMRRDIASYMIDQIVKPKTLDIAIKKGFQATFNKTIDKASAVQRNDAIKFEVIVEDEA